MTTADTAASPTASKEAARESGRGSTYRRTWRRFPRDLGYIALTGPLLLTLYLLLYGIFSAGVSSLAFIVGIVLILGALYGARWLGEFELIRIGWAEPRGIRPVVWGTGTGTTFFSRTFSSLGNSHYWLYLIHAMIVYPIVAVISVTLTSVWILVGVFAALLPLISAAFPGVSWLAAPWERMADYFGIGEGAMMVITVAVGLFLLATLPFVTRVFVLLHFQIDRLLLSGFRSEELQRQVLDLNASRGAAISAEGHSLRRLERDIHDGPQQRLVRLQMDLAAADRQLDNNPEKAHALIEEAMQQSREALDELRSLSRGFAPPILLDRGLVAALQSAATRSAVPTRVVSSLPDGFELPQEIERNAYFIASEALANTLKHADATDIELRVGLRRVADGDTTWLDLVVTDNGSGGAAVLPGHGLAGLDERLRGLGGILVIESPAGGPTMVTAHLPLTY